jgi:hypothetical protein
MKTRACASGLAVVALTAAGCGGGGDTGARDDAAAQQRAVTPPKPTVVTTASAAAASVPAAPRHLSPVPAPGTVRLADGPFNDKLRITALRLRRTDRPQVTGRILTVTDVSEVLALTVDVAFYDRDGLLVSTGHRSLQEVEAFFDKPLRFRVRASTPAPDAVAAVMTIPEYVPE